MKTNYYSMLTLSHDITHEFVQLLLKKNIPLKSSKEINFQTKPRMDASILKGNWNTAVTFHIPKCILYKYTLMVKEAY